jgi:hypothetical protein
MQANGIDPLIIRIVGDNPDEAAWLNGLIITQIPEPTTAVLAVFALCGAAFSRRQR